MAELSRRGEGQRRQLVAAQDLTDQPLPVDGRGKGPPHQRIVKGGHVVGKAKVVGARRRIDVQLRAVDRAVLDGLQRRVGWRDGVQLPALIAGPGRVLVKVIADHPGDDYAPGVIVVLVHFQADMGLLLGFIFIMNMIGAVVLMPALVYLFDGGTEQSSAT